jgi:nicotinate-nucleotide pyrophosphorylase (carboxylating)
MGARRGSARQSLDAQVRSWLAEDLGEAGDVTSEAMVPTSARAVAIVRARAAGTLSGLAVARRIVALGAPRVRLQARRRDGDTFRAGEEILRLTGSLRSILAVERTLLNAMGRLSGVATATQAMVRRVRGTRARVRDTRKTTPGLRQLEKAAVVHGGGTPHRQGLFDAFLCKDNHLAAVPLRRLPAVIEGAVRRARRRHPLSFAMVEVDSAAQFERVAALPRGVVDAVLLDNMTPATLRRLARRRDRVAPWLKLEASGGVTGRTIAAIARSGVDFISCGAITHSAPQVDFGLDIR